jgi:hypothetical protein
VTLQQPAFLAKPAIYWTPHTLSTALTNQPEPLHEPHMPNRHTTPPLHIYGHSVLHPLSGLPLCSHTSTFTPQNAQTTHSTLHQ